MPKDGEKSSKLSIVEEVVASREAKAHRDQDAVEARKKLPQLREELINLLKAHCPRPEGDQFWWGETKEEFPIRLWADIPDPSGVIQVEIAASEYPNGKEKDEEYIKFRVSLEDLDRRCILEPGEATVESISFRSSAPRYKQVIGESYSVYPIWRREATVSDMEAFSGLLARLKESDVTFSLSPTKE